MPRLIDLLDGHLLSGISGNLATDLVKSIWERATRRSWEDLFLDAFQQAIDQGGPWLAKYGEDKALLQRDVLRQVLHQNLGAPVETMSLGQLTDEDFAASVAGALANIEALAIPGHTLRQEDYAQLVTNLVRSALALFRSSIIANPGSFEEAMLRAESEDRARLHELRAYLEQRFDVALTQIAELQARAELISHQIQHLESSQGHKALIPPSPPDTFVGRAKVLQELSSRLLRSSDEAMSIAIQGMGGAGKTSLALKLGRDLIASFPGGVLWVATGPTAQAQEIVDKIAGQLGMDTRQEVEPNQVLTTLRHALIAQGRMLVLMDDVWDANLGRWIRDQILPYNRALVVTTRDLAIGRELCGYVEQISGLTESEALELLTSILGDLGEYDVFARELAVLAGGLPLALDLAARLCDSGPIDLAWVVSELRARSAVEVLRLEGEETRDRSLSVCLRLSYDRLDQNLQARFRALGVLTASPASLHALAAIWDDPDLQVAEVAARHLVRRGLLQRFPLPNPAGSQIDPNAFIQHTLLQQFAFSLLQQADEHYGVALRHAEHYRRVATANWQAADPYLEQIGHAWRWISGQALTLQLRFHHDTSALLVQRGRWLEYGAHASHLLTLVSESSALLSERSILLLDLCRAESALGDPVHALEHARQALAISRQLGDSLGEVKCLLGLGVIYHTLGDLSHADEVIATASKLAIRIGDVEDEVAALLIMGAIYSARGDKLAALELYEKSLMRYRKLGDKHGEAAALNNLGFLNHAIGRDEAAVANLSSALGLRREIGDKDGEAETLDNLGLIYARCGDTVRAQEQYQAALVLVQDTGNKRVESTLLNNLGRLQQRLGHYSRAYEYLEAALLQKRTIADKRGEASVLGNIGSLRLDMAEPDEAISWFELALSLYREVGDKNGEAQTLINYGIAHERLDKADQAMALYEAARSLAYRSGDISTELLALEKMIGLAVRQKDWPQAFRYRNEAIQRANLAGDGSAQVEQLRGLGYLCAQTGKHADALAHFENALIIVRQLGDKSREAMVLHDLAQARMELGQLQGALEDGEASLVLAEQLKDLAGERTVRETLAFILTRLGDLKRTQEQWQRVTALDEITGNPEGQWHREALLRVEDIIATLGNQMPRG